MQCVRNARSKTSGACEVYVSLSPSRNVMFPSITNRHEILETETCFPAGTRSVRLRL